MPDFALVRLRAQQEASLETQRMNWTGSKVKLGPEKFKLGRRSQLGKDRAGITWEVIKDREKKGA